MDSEPVLLKGFDQQNQKMQSLHLIHTPTLLRIAREEAGIVLTEMQNLQDFYEENKIPFETKLKSALGPKVRPQPKHLNVLGLIFVLVLSPLSWSNSAFLRVSTPKLST